MKIAILSPFYPFRGGIAQFSGRLYSELSKKHQIKAFNFTVLYPSFLFPGKTQFVTEDDSAMPIDSEGVLNSINPLSYYQTARAINKFCPDILIIPSWMSLLAPALGTVCRLVGRKTKIVGLVHNAIPHEKRFFDKLFAKYFFSCCDGFVVLSDSVGDDLRSLYPKANILLTPHPIYDHYGAKIGQNDAREHLHIAKDKKTLLFFGLIRKYKGLDILINAMQLLDNSYQLLIAGECYGDFQEYQTLIEQSPRKASIKVMEQYIPDDLVPILFSASDVLVLPYRDATQSGVVAVAYQMETPMIATNVGALGETLREASTGIVTEDISSEALAVAIKKFFDNQSETDTYIHNIRNEKTRLSWSAFVEAFENFSSKI